MSSSSLDRFAAAFERLRQMSPEQREQELAALSLDSAQRDQLRRMLEADAQDDDLLARTVNATATRLASTASQRIGPYRLLRELGAGGMGTVFLAQRIEGGFKQQVAVKLLRGFPTSDGLRRLRQERQILAALEHPHIARLLDGGETADGQPWLALEYVDGLPLLQHAAKHAPTLAQRLALFDGMLDAVAHAHRHLVVHRDLKPGNVLVTQDGEVKLLDFGIARLIDLDTKHTEDATSTRVYSLGYASPEQVAGRAVTTASDIFSLGILLRELLVAQRADGRPVADLEPLRLDADLVGILTRATELEPTQRYASAGEFADDLQRYRENRPVRAARMTRWYRARKFLIRHRLAAFATTCALLVLATFIWRLDQERNRALVAEAASKRDAASAHTTVQFLVDTLGAAAPDVAQSRNVSVRDLLDTARKRLDANTLDPEITRTVQTLLAGVYADLGELKIALELFAQGLAGATPGNRKDALVLSDILDRYATLLAQAGQVEQGRQVAAQARAWRAQFAPGEAEEEAKSLLTQGQLEHHAGDNAKAIELTRQAMQLATPQTPLPAPLALEITVTLASLLGTNGNCEEAGKIAAQGLEYTKSLAPDAVNRVPLLRAQAISERMCGKYVQAETTLRKAIAIQQHVVGGHGVRMGLLLNDLALILNDLGRYREASDLLAQSALAGQDLDSSPIETAITLSNRAGILENVGDYPQALALQEQAQAVLDAAAVEPQSFAGRNLARNHARTLALAGQTSKAIEILAHLLAQAREIDGENSAEYAMVTWQRALAERRAGQIGAALADTDEAERRFVNLVPHAHPFFAHVHRLRAALAASQGELQAAEREQLTAIKQLEDAESIDIDLAIARCELAEIQHAQGRNDDAHATLAAALPRLREALLPGEVARAAAERTAKALGFAPPTEPTRAN
ncbi:MAG: serine/threonine-protein kinase [Dokdonella sp.]|uniref:serine/threonine-protein kinase n=1 Tax=Dokdonella sp. TaxID=2291710 RepID=UPI0025B7EC47|nr:serine/threonine-protein kinase [Dokdonella sp.]MBZ0224062.1 serine/threonine-protein kinase [Dokdonella sp.]